LREVWFGFATIAEQYGIWEAAATMYNRVEKPKTDYPGASYDIAQQRLTAMHNRANASPKPARQ
jgi:hypothetical protein